MTDEQNHNASGASLLSGKLCPQEPIYKAGEILVELCIHHRYASGVDLKTGASWMECTWCGKKKNW